MEVVTAKWQNVSVLIRLHVQNVELPYIPVETNVIKNPSNTVWFVHFNGRYNRCHRIEYM